MRIIMMVNLIFLLWEVLMKYLSTLLVGINESILINWLKSINIMLKKLNMY